VCGISLDLRIYRDELGGHDFDELAGQKFESTWR
jgi:hypothetical protein